MAGKMNDESAVKGTGDIKRITLHASDFAKYDFDKVDDRAQAVRRILAALGFHEESDREWAAHVLDGYQMLMSSDLVMPCIRKPTPEELELFHAGCYKAVSAQSAPALTDYVALLHPMVSTFNPTVGTDDSYRISLGWWFFDPSLKTIDRAGIIVHEVMHGVLGHYELPRLNHRLVNIAGDAVINQGIERSGDVSMRLPKCEDGTDMFVFPRTLKTKAYPNGMEEHLSFDAYYAALEEEQKSEEQQQQGQGGNGQGRKGSGSISNDGGGNASGSNASDDGNGSTTGADGNDGNGGGSSQAGVVMQYEDGTEQPMTTGGQPCHEMSPEEINEMDRQGVEKAGQLEKEMAHATAQTKAMEQARKNRGMGGSSFNDFLLDALMPPKIKWTNILKGIISRQFNVIVNGGVDYSYRRPSRRSDPNGFIRPSMVAYAPSVIVGCDTSGSMGEKDYSEALGEIEGLCKTLHCADLRFVTIDTEITSNQVVHHAKDVKLKGGGGTMMEPFARYVNALPRSEKPDLTILCTDGYCDWSQYVNALDITRHNIILVTDEGGMEQGKNYADGSVQNLTVLPIY